MMEALYTSETSVHFNVTTRRYIPEDSKLQQIRRLNCSSIEEWLVCYFVGLKARQPVCNLLKVECDDPTKPVCFVCMRMFTKHSDY
jgi:hypothetical protein